MGCCRIIGSGGCDPSPSPSPAFLGEGDDTGNTFDWWCFRGNSMRRARIGELNQRVRVDQPVVVQDALGEEIVTWQALCSTWAAMRNVPQREPFVADQFVSVVSTTFTLRYRTDVTAKMRLVSRGIVYEIDSAADPDGGLRFTELVCTVLERGG